MSKRRRRPQTSPTLPDRPLLQSIDRSCRWNLAGYFDSRLRTARMSATSDIAAQSIDAVQTVEPAGRFQRSTSEGRRLYDASFWLAYAANFALMAAVTLLYRYADFVVGLGGTEFDVGRIVGLGMIGSLMMRSFKAWASTAMDPAEYGWPRSAG